VKRAPNKDAPGGRWCQRPLRLEARPPLAIVVAVMLASLPAVPSPASGQEANPRFGVWKLRSDAPPPAVNVMTYAPWGEGGMRVTVAATNASGATTTWGYVTLFDGVFRPVDGREGSETAVEVVDERTNRITTRRDGQVVQVILNTLSEDGRRIDNEYRSRTDDGGERVTRAVYDRIREEGGAAPPVGAPERRGGWLHRTR
jgi:hypothetical protein